MIARKIVGPQEQFERSGAQSLRDIRPFTVRLSEFFQSSASSLVLAAVGVGTFVEPAAVDIAVPAAALYAAWVLTRRVKLPLRLPATSGLPDYSDPMPGSRKPRQAAGSIFLGWSIDGQEIWISPEDAREHMTIPGTTGAGKTSTILSVLVNALAQGSGFVLVDGKGDRDLYGKVLALARRLGREDDVRVLNFMVASGTKDSNRFNPFASGNADAIRELLASQLGDQAAGDANGVFRERAVALMGTITPLLVWLRDNKGVPLNIDGIRRSLELDRIWKVATERVFLMHDPETGGNISLDLGKEIPAEVIDPLRAYIGELPGYRSEVPLEKQPEEPVKQHGYALFYFTPVFTHLAGSLGHIFRCDTGDVDMRDIVLNRRILVVNLPALENSDATLAALGKLVVASLRGMMAQLLGVSLEGEYTAIDKPGMGPTPFPVVLDELAYYATSGMDRMLAMGRGLNMSFMLGFQEVSGIWARLGEKTASLLGNANLTIAMRQQDAGRTREWLEKTAGQTYVTQATSYHGANDGMYRESRQADVRQVSRVDWNDLTSLVEGEAVILLGSRRVYARLFHAEIDDTGPKRIGATLSLAAPDPQQVRAREQRVEAIVDTIARGAVGLGAEEPPSAGLSALIQGFATAVKGGCNGPGCVCGALDALAGVPADQLPAMPSPADGSVATSVTPMLVTASRATIPGGSGSGLPSEPVDARLIRIITEVERLSGVSEEVSRRVALTVLADRDRALEAAVVVEPRQMSPEVFVQQVQAVVAGLNAAGRGVTRRAA